MVIWDADNIETPTSTMFERMTYQNGVLNVFLRNYTQYEYRQIPMNLWHHMRRAASAGSFFNTYIKNVYQYTRKQ